MNKLGSGAGYAVIGGGRNNSVADNADYATIPGGMANAQASLMNAQTGRRYCGRQFSVVDLAHIRAL